MSQPSATSPSLLGIHHVTAIASDPQANLDFYTGVLGLRLVKKTVNYDDPQTYHLYYGDGEGRPGSILTFFPWPGARRGQRGAGQATRTAFAVPAGSLGYWAERLSARGVEVDAAKHFGDELLVFADPDDLRLELVERPDEELRAPWSDGPVPAAQAIRSFDGVTLEESDAEATAEHLTRELGFRLVAEADGRQRFVTGEEGVSGRVDVVARPGAGYGRIAAGTVHHVAFRVADDRAQWEWRQRLLEAGHQVTPVMDRNYFHSIYFREPGGVLFELATDPPGFGIDEPVAGLGSALRLPPFLESERARLERVLPPLRTPAAAGGAA